MPLQFGRAGAAGQAHDLRLAKASKQQEVAGIDRHPEMGDGAACLLDSGRDDIAPIRDRARAEDQNGIATFFGGFTQRGGECRGLVRHAAFKDDLRIQRVKACVERGAVLVEQ